jgi:hypothetical protein
MARTRAIGIALACALLLAPGVFAQFATGNVYGTVTDSSGAVLPGANVTLTGGTIGKRNTTSGPQGDFRFLGLDPGTYTLAVALQGFTSAKRDVIVKTASSVTLNLVLNIGGMQESVVIEGSTPVIDTKQTGTSTTLTKDELAEIPQSRDPWATLKTVPGVLVDRVNVAGNESGQQSNFIGKGSNVNDTMWVLDGVVITDSGSPGASPNYWDFDSFEEIAVNTGGNDIKVQTAGLGINFVTKRGTNAFHGSVRDFLANHKLQSNNLPSALVGDPRLNGTGTANHINQVNDYGAELGGPIIPDKLWFWGAYGKQDIRITRLSQTPDKTLLKNFNAKLNWQASPNDMVSFFYNNGEKDKFGRSPGQAGNEADSFLWNQGNAYPTSGCHIPCGLHGLFKFEEEHTFSSKFYLDAKYAFFNWGYGFQPRGGTGQNYMIDRVNDAASGSYLVYQSERPWQIANLDATYFAPGLGGNNELKFGFGWRSNPVTSTTAWSGDKLGGIIDSNGTQHVRIWRDGIVNYETKYTSGYVADTYTKDRLTVNLGLRYDYQTGQSNPSSVPANPAFPNLLPAISYGGSTDAEKIKWKDFSPRVGFTYALDNARKMIVRASFARYAGALGGNPDAFFANPVATVFLDYGWAGPGAGGKVQPNQVLLNQFNFAAGVDPANPTALQSTNKIDPNYHANHDNEFIVGIEREIAPNFGVNLAYTYKRAADYIEWTPRIGMTSADYTPTAPVTVVNGGTTFTSQGYAPNDALVAASGGGFLLTNRPNYHTTYNGIELSINKRLSNKWMLRAAGAWMSFNEYYDGPAAFANPTHTDIPDPSIGVQSGPAGAVPLSGPGVNGGAFAPQSSGSGKGDIFYNAKWQFTVNALYQLPAGFEIATSIFGRQGFARPVVVSVDGGDDGTLNGLAAGTVDAYRYPSVFAVDFRLAKTQKIAGNTSLQISLDLFNAFNNNVVLAQSRFADSAVFGRINEILSPRILRLGVRFQF